MNLKSVQSEPRKLLVVVCLVNYDDKKLLKVCTNFIFLPLQSVISLMSDEILNVIF